MDSDSTFHPASQLYLAFASPMTPMCVKMAALPVHLSPRTSINTLDKLRIIALIYQIKKPSVTTPPVCRPRHAAQPMAQPQSRQTGSHTSTPHGQGRLRRTTHTVSPPKQRDPSPTLLYAPGLSKAVPLHGQRPTRPARLDTVFDESTVPFDTPTLLYAPGLSKAVPLHGQRPTRPARLDTVFDESTVSFDAPTLLAGDTTPLQYAPLIPD